MTAVCNKLNQHVQMPVICKKREGDARSKKAGELSPKKERNVGQSRDKKEGNLKHKTKTMTQKKLQRSRAPTGAVVDLEASSK